MIVDQAFVNVERFRKYATLNLQRILGMLLDMVEEEALNPALMQYNLLEPREANGYIRNAI